MDALLPRPQRDTQPEDYEGLVYATAALVAPLVQEEFEDIAQLLRVKVWRALEAFDPTRSRLPRRRYVFMCVTNQVKDIKNRKRRYDLHIEALGEDGAAHDGFELRYLAVDAEVVYAEVDDEPLVLPTTLSAQEGQVVILLCEDYKQAEVGRMLHMDKRGMERAMRAIRSKMADWKPTPPVKAGLELLSTLPDVGIPVAT